MSDLATITATGDFEACAVYRAPIEHDEPLCAGCGHLFDDHAAARAGATVTALRSRRPAISRRPASKAS